MIQIKDVIHLYINGEARHRVTYYDHPPEQVGIWVKLTTKRFQLLNDLSILKVEYALKRLSDMTEEEALHLARIYTNADKIKRTTGVVSNFFYFFCEFRSGDKGTRETLIMHDGEAWYRHYFEDKPGCRTGKHHIVRPFEATHYLLKQGFDLFGLIESGQAFDIKTIHL